LKNVTIDVIERNNDVLGEKKGIDFTNGWEIEVNSISTSTDYR